MTPARIPSDALVVLIGASSSGKSTLAARSFRAEQVVSSDDLRAVVGESSQDQRASTDAFDVLDRIVAARVSRRLLTVIDTLGLDATRRQAAVALARTRSMPTVAVRLTTSGKEVRRRNKDRSPPLRPLPAAAIRRQLTSAEALTDDELRDEGFETILTVPDDTTIRVVPSAFVAAPELRERQIEEPLHMRFGLQISRFDPPAAELGSHLRDVAVAAEQAGFDSLWLMDHMIQIPQVGREWEDMLEPITTLAHLAAATSTIRLGTLVAGITYRNIAHLGKAMATLDVLSGGRAICGLGAAWFEREHRAYGYDFPPVGERYDALRDALELLPLLWGPGTPAFEGRTISVPEAICYPRPLQEKIPVLVGGSGEKTTLRLVAEYADACNLFGDIERVTYLIDVLHQHCEDVGRDPSEVEITTLQQVLAAPDDTELAERVAAVTPAGRTPEPVAAGAGAGTVEDQIGRFRAFAEAGVNTVMVSLPIVTPGRVAELAPLISAFAAPAPA